MSAKPKINLDVQGGCGGIVSVFLIASVLAAWWYL